MDGTITIRRASEQDRRAVSRLAQLDSRQFPDGEALLAIIDGELQAALQLSEGVLLANPFKPTERLAELLRVWAGRQPGARVSPSKERRLRLPVRAPRLLRRPVRRAASEARCP